jgi:hypothetical protein
LVEGLSNAGCNVANVKNDALFGTSRRRFESCREVLDGIGGSVHEFGLVTKRRVGKAKQERAAETDTGRSELYQCSGNERLRINE